MRAAVISTHREETGVKVQQSHEHEHKQYSTAQLHVLLWRTLSHGRDPSEHALPFRTRFGQQQKQTTSEGKVSGRGERTVIFGWGLSELQSVKLRVCGVWWWGVTVAVSNQTQHPFVQIIHPVHSTVTTTSNNTLHLTDFSSS